MTGMRRAPETDMRFLRNNPYYFFTVCFAAILFCSSNRAAARIGETALQFIDRYGAPKDTPSSKIMDKNSPLVEGAIHHTYEYQGWRIRAAFLRLDGPAIRMDFQKMSGAPNGIAIQDYELEAIMRANAPAGMTWARMAYDNPDSPNKGFAKAAEAFVAVGQRMWRRNDGAILWCRGNIIIRLELPDEEERRKLLSGGKFFLVFPHVRII
jgi:FAD/FMN-containing dehydrogenase